MTEEMKATVKRLSEEFHKRALNAKDGFERAGIIEEWCKAIRAVKAEQS